MSNEAAIIWLISSEWWQGSSHHEVCHEIGVRKSWQNSCSIYAEEFMWLRFKDLYWEWSPSQLFLSDFGGPMIYLTCN